MTDAGSIDSLEVLEASELIGLIVCSISDMARSKRSVGNVDSLTDNTEANGLSSGCLCNRSAALYALRSSFVPFGRPSIEIS